MVTSEQQGKAVVIQPHIKSTANPGIQQVLSANVPSSSITSAASSGTATPQLVVASVQPTLPGSSKLIFTSAVSANSTNSLTGLLSTAANATNTQKTNVVTLQQSSDTTHLKITPGTSPRKVSGKWKSSFFLCRKLCFHLPFVYPLNKIIFNCRTDSTETDFASTKCW